MHPLHRRPRRLCYLHRRSDCFYRVERSSSRAGYFTPAVDQRLFTAHCNRLVTSSGSPLDRCSSPITVFGRGASVAVIENGHIKRFTDY
jgi:hypothetical protein